MNNDMNVKIGIGLSVDQSTYKKTLRDLDTLKTAVTRGNTDVLDMSNFSQDLKDAYIAAEKLNQILHASWNGKIGQLDMSKFNSEIQKGFTNIAGLKAELSKGGDLGKTIFNNFASSVLHSNVQLKQTSKILDELAVSMGNTIKWGLTSSIFNKLTGSVQKAWDYSKQLDSSLNDIRIVTGKSADEMERFAKTANSAAQNLGTSTKDFVNASLIYYQQGDNDAVAQAKAEVTLKAANVTGQSASEVSEQLTAVWNGYKVSAAETELYIDKLAAVAAATAADLEELSTGLSKVASAANLMGVDIDQLNAQLATIVSVTRQAPESVGVALKTIFARMSDIEAGLDSDTTLGNYTAQMAALGVNILDAQHKLRSMGDVIEEIGAKWSSYSREQQIALAQIMAGTRQYNNLLALFDNWDKYEDALLTSSTAAGTLNEQQEIYMESVEAHLKALATEAEETYDILFNEKLVNNFFTQLTDGLKMVNIYLSSIQKVSGSFGVFGQIGAIGANIFQKQAGNALNKQILNKEAKDSNSNRDEVLQGIRQAHAAEGTLVFNDTALEEEIKISEKIAGVQDMLTESELKDLTTQQQKVGILTQQLEIMNSYVDVAKQLKAEGYLTFDNATQITSKTFDEGRKTLQEEMVKVNTDLENIKQLLDEMEQIRQDRDAFHEKWGIESDEAQVHVAGSMFNKVRDQYPDKDTDKLRRERNYWSASSMAMNILDDTYTGVRERDPSQGGGYEIYDITTKIVEDLERASVSLSDESQEYVQELQDSVIETGQLTEEQFDKLNMIITEVEQKYNQRMDLLNQASQGYSGTARGDKGKVQEEIELTRENIDTQIDLKKRAQELTDVVGGLSAAWAILGNATSAVGSIFNDQLSGWEKAQNIIQAGTSALIMYAMNAQQLANVLPILVKNLHLAADAEAAKQFVEEKGIITTTLSIAKELILKGVRKVSTFVTEAYTKAIHGNRIAQLGWIAAVAAAIVAAVALVKVIADALSTEKKLTKELEESKKALREAGEAYKEVKELFSAYQEGEDAIRGLKQGTIEWTEAILEANNAAQELIDKWKLVAGQDYVLNASGLIQIKDEVLEQKMFEEQQKVYLAQAKNYRKQENYYRESKVGGMPYWQQKAKEDVSAKVNSVAGQPNFPYVKGSYLKEVDKDILKDGWLEEDFKGLLAETAQNTGNALTYDKANVEGTRGIQDEIKKNTIDVTDAIKESLDGYYLANQNATTYELLAADALLMGTLSKPDAEAYMNKTEFEKNLYQQYIAKHSTDTGEEIRVIDPMAPSLNRHRNYYKESTYKDAWMETHGYSKVENPNKKWWQDDQWQDENGNILTSDQVNRIRGGINMTEAKKAYTEDEYAVTQNMPTFEASMMTNRGIVSGAFTNQESQDYLTMAKTAGQHNLDFDYSVLTEEELKWLKSDAMANPNSYSTEQYNDIMKAQSDATARAAQDLKNFNDEISLQATQLGTSETALKLYVKTMRDSTGAAVQLNKTTAKQAAGQYEFNKAYNDSRDAFTESKDAYKAWYNAAKNGTKVSYDVVDSVAELTESLSAMFGFEVDADFMEKHYEDIQKMLSGTAEEAEKAYKRIMKNNLIDALTKNFGSSMTTTQIDSWAEHIANLDPGEAMDAAWTTHLMNMINSGNYTKEELEGIFKQMNIEMPPPEALEYEMGTVKGNGSKVEHTYDGEMVVPNALGGYSVKDVKYSWTETVSPVEKEYVKFKNQPLTLTKSNDSGGNFTPKAPKGSTAKPKVEEHIEDNKDIYHDVDIALKRINTRMERLGQANKKLIGNEWLKNMNEQFISLNDEITVTEEKIKIAEGEMNDLQNTLSGNGVTFNANGSIANYAEAYDAELARVNAVISHYNSLSASGQEAYQATLDAAKERFDKFVEDMERYDEVTTDLIPGLQDNIQNALDKQTELKIEAFNYEIDLRLETAEATRNWNEFKMEVLDGIDEDDILGRAQAALGNFATYYNDEETGTIQRLTNHLNDIMEELNQYSFSGTMETFSDNEKAALDNLSKYIDSMKGELEGLYELAKQIRESYLKGMEKAEEGFGKQLEIYSQISSLIEHDMNLIQLLYGENSYSELATYYEQQHANNLQQLEFQRMERDFWADQMAHLEEGTDEWEMAKEKWLEATNEVNQGITSSIESLRAKYTNAIEEIFQKLNNSLTNGKGLAYAGQEWDLINKNADRYLDTIDGIYAIQKLENNYQKAIDDSDGLKTQKELKSIMDSELKALREKDKLTQYDVDRAELRYQIALKQIALEEAQQNKTQMRLRRDSQGNYTYQYTADEEQVNTLQSEMSDLYQQLYDLDSNKYRENLNELYTIWSEFQEAMKAAEQIVDEEEKQRQKALLTKHYGEIINNIVAEDELIKKNLYESTMSGLLDLYNNNTANYDLMTQDQKDILENFIHDQEALNTGAYNNLFGLYDNCILEFQGMADAQKEILVGSMLPQWNSTLKSMMDTFVAKGGFEEVCKTAFEELEAASLQYQNGLKEIETTAGTSFESIRDGYDSLIPKTQTLLKENQKLIDTYGLELAAIKSVIDELDKLIKKYEAATKAAEETVIAAQKLKTETENKAADETQDEDLEDDRSDEDKENEIIPAAKTDPDLGLTDDGHKVRDIYTIQKGDTLWSIARKYGFSSWRPLWLANTYIKDPDLIHTGNKLKIPQYASGGYTGDWAGSNGQLAMLHKKELVLNARDTANMLNAVEILRNITKNLSSTLLNKMAELTAGTSMNLLNPNDTLEQIVHIDAQFPNVTNSSEIEDALNNLVNRAAQHITKN